MARVPTRARSPPLSMSLTRTVSLLMDPPVVFCARCHFLPDSYVLAVYIESRQAYPIKQLQLTPIAVKFPFNACTKVVRAELVANKVCMHSSVNIHI